MDIKILRSINPWWEEGDFEERDAHLKLLKNLPYVHFPEWTGRISLEPFSLNFVIGPRQVGKTTGLKIMIRDIIKKGQDPGKIIYIDCEIFPDFAYLRDSILYLLENFDKELIIILDEASSLKHWWKAVKFLIDAGKLSESVLVVSGSSSLQVKKDVELFPGRTGKGVTVEALPITFPEFLRLHHVKNYKKNYDRVITLFEKYLNTGGFLSVINEIPETEILKGFIGEFTRHQKNLEICRETFSSLISKIPSCVSFRTIASETSGYSYKVIQDYLEFFRHLYIIGFAYLKENKKIYYRKEKKFFFRDPLLLRIFSTWSATKFLESALYENIVQEHMYRRFGEIYYYRNKYEVDCLADNIKVEVKAGKPHRKYPKGVEVLDYKEIPIFLIELFTAGSPP